MSLIIPELVGSAFSGVEFKFCKVTPELAAVWLRRNIKNRRVKPKTLSGYVMDMRNGAWMTTHQGIAFDSAGNLLDGQHRLMAIVKSKVSVILLVSTGWPVAMDPKHMTMDAVDRGLARSLADQLHLQHGIEPREAAGLVKICNSIACFCIGSQRVPKSSTDSILTVFGLYKREISWLLASPTKQAGLSVAQVFAAAAMARSVFDENKLDDFLTRFLTGENLTKENPILPLRNWLLGATGKDIRKESTRWTVFHHILSFVEGKPCASLVMHSDVAYKKVIGLSHARVQKIRAVYSEMSREFAQSVADAKQNGHVEKPKTPAPVPVKEVDLPAGSMMRKVYFEAAKSPEQFTAAALAVAMGNGADSIGIALIQLERRGYVKFAGNEDGQRVYKLNSREVPA